MHRSLRLPVVVSAVCTLAHVSTVAAAQGIPAPRDTLAKVVVTATRVAVSTVAPTATTTVLFGDELRAAGITRVVDALRLVPGAAIVSSGAVGSQTSLFLRGGNSNYVRVLVDGVPVNDAGGAFDFASLTTDNVERIEVVRGPASVLYGSDAVTGVVQIFTRFATGPATAHALYGRGSFGTTRSEFGYSAGNSGAGISLTGARDATDGILPFNNRFTNDVLSASVRAAPDPRSDVRVAARWSASAFHYPTDYTGAVVDQNAEQSDHRFVLSVDAGRRFGSRAEIRALLTSDEYLPRSNDAPDGPADTLGFFGFFSRAVRTHRAADARLNWRYAARGVLTVGGELAVERERSSSVSLSQYGVDSGGFAADRHNSGWYAQAVGDATNRVSYSVGARLDRNSAFGSFPTMRTSIAYVLSGVSRMRASIGSAFKAPSFFENFSTGFVTGNPALRPEQSRSAELGYDRTLGGGALTVRTTAYMQWFHDVIDYSGSTPPGAPNYFNVAAAEAKGLEIETAYHPDDDVTLTASYAWTDTRATAAGFDKSSGANYVVGEKLIRRPPQLFTFQAAQRIPGGGSMHLVVARVGERDDRDFAAFPASPVVLPAYTKVDVALQVPVLAQVSRNLALMVRMDNALGAKYAEVLRFAAPGRSVFVALRLGR